MGASLEFLGNNKKAREAGVNASRRAAGDEVKGVNRCRSL